MIATMIAVIPIVIAINNGMAINIHNTCAMSCNHITASYTPWSQVLLEACGTNHGRFDIANVDRSL